MARKISLVVHDLDPAGDGGSNSACAGAIYDSQEIGTFKITIYAWCFGTMVSGQTLEKEYHIVVSK